MKALYQIGSDYMELMNSLSDGELTEKDEEKLQQITEQLLNKTDNVCSWVRSQEDLVMLAEAKIEELQAFKAKIVKRLDKFDGYVNSCLDLIGKTEIQGSLNKIKKHKPREVLEVFDEGQIPNDFVKVPEAKPEIMKAEIKKAIEAGVDVPGARIVESKKITIKYTLK